MRLMLALALVLLSAGAAFADPITGFLATTAFATFTWGQVIYASAIAASSTYTYLRGKKQQRELQSKLNSSGGGGFATSQTYSWGAIGTVWSAMGEIVPVVLGTHRVGGRAIQSFTRKEGGTDYYYGLFCMSHGEVSDIRSIEINGEASANFSGVSTDTRMGTAGQTAIAWFQDINTQFSQSGKRILRSANTTYTVSANCDKVRVKFSMTHGFSLAFSAQQDAGGVITAAGYPYPHHYCRIKHVGGSTYDAFDYIGGTFSPVTFEVEITGTFTAGQVLQFINDVAASGAPDGEWDQYSYAVTGGPGTITISNYIEIASVTETSYGTGAGYTYPNYALLGVRIPATNQLSGGAPEITAIVDGVKCTVPTYLPTATWTDNPAWCLYECLTNTRWGAGSRITAAKINLASFKTLADYCDALVNDGAGSTEKRFRLNMVLDSEHKISDIANYVANLTSSHEPVISGGQLVIKTDVAVTTPSQLFTTGNVKAGTLRWAFNPKDSLYNSITVEFLDASNGYERRVLQLPLTDETTDLLPEMKVNLFGCTKLSQAIRTARFLLREARYRDSSVSFEAMLDSIACEPGDKIRVGHKQQQQLLSGNLVSYGTQYVVFPEPYTFEVGSTYAISTILTTDVVQALTVDMTVMSGVTSSIVHINESLATIGANPRARAPYTLGLASNAYDDYILKSISRSTENEMSVTAVKYDATMWDGIDTFTVADVTSTVAVSGTQTPQQCTNLVLRESLTTAASGETISNLLVSFSPPSDSPGWHHARVYLNMVYDDQPVVGYQYYGDSTGQTIIPNVPRGVTLGVIVQSVSTTGLYASYDDAPAATIVPLGVNVTPIDVAGVTLTQVGEDVLVSWTESADAATITYEVRRGASWSSGRVIGRVVHGMTQITDPTVLNDTYQYLVCGRNVAGAYSATPATASITVSGIVVENVAVEQAEEPTWAGTKIGMGVVGATVVGNTDVVDIISGVSVIANNQQTGHEISKAFDRDAGTEWYSLNPFYFPVAQNTYIDIDTGDEQFVVKQVQWEHGNLGYAVNVSVKVSTDGVTFTESHNEDASSGDTTDTFIIADSPRARYIRLHLMPPASDFIMTAKEFYVTGIHYGPSYVTAAADLGQVMTGHLMYSMTGGVIADPDNATWPDYWGDNDTWAAAFSSDSPTSWDDLDRTIPPTIEYRLTNDDPTASPTWSAWAEYIYGQYTFRAAQFKITFTLLNGAQYAIISNFSTIIDVAGVIVYINNFAIAAAGSTLTYADYLSNAGVAANYTITPRIIVTIKDAGKVLTPDVSGANSTSATITAYNTSDTAESAIADIDIIGR